MGFRGVLALLDEEVRFYAEKTSDQWGWFTDEIDSFTLRSVHAAASSAR